MRFSLIIPVYNRPDEIHELLESLCKQDFYEDFEVVVVEDGSTIPCETVIDTFRSKLLISYYNKPNSGPGDSRNFGMKMARNDYFLIFDSDCIIPSGYLTAVNAALAERYTDCFGGPDAALESFSDVQKAINFAMTSFLTTGGIRGGSEALDKFQPRSFNMGISRKAFEASGGFGNIHPGEDPDLSIRLWKIGYETRLVPQAYVWHKRRIDWQKFYKQVNKFGKARPILDKWYPKYAKLTFWAPAVFITGFVVALFFAAASFPYFLFCYEMYFLLIFLTACIQTRNLKIGFYALMAVAVQFYGYGTGFIQSFIKVRAFGKKPEKAFPELFFKR